MDILFLIKSEHSRLMELMSGLEEALALGDHEGVQAHLQSVMAALEVFVHLDRDLIYPEFAALVGSHERSVEDAQAHHQSVLALLNALKDQAGRGLVEQGQVSELLNAMRQHILRQQTHVVPRIRELIPTQDREDLGQVYLDMKEELAAALLDPRSSLPLREQVG